MTQKNICMQRNSQRTERPRIRLRVRVLYSQSQTNILSQTCWFEWKLVYAARVNRFYFFFSLNPAFCSWAGWKFVWIESIEIFCQKEKFIKKCFSFKINSFGLEKNQLQSFLRHNPSQNSSWFEFVASPTNKCWIYRPSRLCCLSLKTMKYKIHSLPALTLRWLIFILCSLSLCRLHKIYIFS